jgi:hypothetical protein
MSKGMNLFMPGKPTIPAGLGSVALPAAGTLMLTRRAGEGKMPGNGDDVRQAFSFPSRVAGATVSQAVAAANLFVWSGNTIGQPRRRAQAPVQA